MTQKIQITIRDDTDVQLTLDSVKEVIKEGRISKGKHRDLYCFATVRKLPNGDELIVLTNDTKEVDSFDVYKIKTQKDHE